MSRSLRAVALGFLLLAPLAAAAWDADDGRAGDAPNVAEAAWHVEPHVIRGAVRGEQDVVDWYAADLPEGSFVRVTNDGETEPLVNLRADFDASVFSWALPPGEALALRSELTSVVIGVAESRNPATVTDDMSYAIRLERLPVPAGEDDAGSGRDAPDRVGREPLLPAGAYAADLDPATGDHVDVFRLDAPFGQVVRVRLLAEGLSPVFLRLRDATTGESRVDAGRDIDVSLRARGSEGMLLELRATTGGHYVFSWEALPLPDVRVVSLEVEDAPITVGGTATPANLARRVHVTVENAGAGAAVDALVVVDARHRGGSGHLIGIEEVTLEPAERRTLSFFWDTLGEAGDVPIVATVLLDDDADDADNEMSRIVSLLVGNTGRSFDAGARSFTLGAPGATAFASYDARSVDVSASARTATDEDLYVWVNPAYNTYMVGSRSVDERLRAAGLPTGPSPIHLPLVP